MQVGTLFRTRDADLKTKKLDLWLIPWSLTLSDNIDLEHVGLCNSEHWLKQSRSSLLQMFFKIGSFKNFAISMGNTCLRVYSKKVLGLQALLKRVSWGVCSLSLCLHVLCYTKHCTNNSLLSRGKTISYLLELIDHVLLISIRKNIKFC